VVKTTAGRASVPVASNNSWPFERSIRTAENTTRGLQLLDVTTVKIEAEAGRWPGPAADLI